MRRLLLLSIYHSSRSYPRSVFGVRYSALVNGLFDADDVDFDKRATYRRQHSVNGNATSLVRWNAHTITLLFKSLKLNSLHFECRKLQLRVSLNAHCYFVNMSEYLEVHTVNWMDHGHDDNAKETWMAFRRFSGKSTAHRESIEHRRWGRDGIISIYSLIQIKWCNFVECLKRTFLFKHLNISPPFITHHYAIDRCTHSKQRKRTVNFRDRQSRNSLCNMFEREASWHAGATHRMRRNVGWNRVYFSLLRCSTGRR